MNDHETLHRLSLLFALVAASALPGCGGGGGDPGATHSTVTNAPAPITAFPPATGVQPVPGSTTPAAPAPTPAPTPAPASPIG